MLKKIEIFTIDVYYSVEHHGINKSHCVTLKFENQQSIVIGPKFIFIATKY